MNDAEIIKALECCSTTKGGNCKECPFYAYEESECQQKAINEAHELSQRQQAEIERLKKIQQRQADLIIEERGRRYELASQFATAKSEAIKEFAKKINTRLQDVSRLNNDGTVYFLVGYELIEKIAKEMEGEKNNG
jgi:hypothetical protein